MTDVEIERCVCGAEAALTHSGNEDYPESMTPHYECQSWLTTGRSCWIGPEAATPEEALRLWNPLMRAARERARLQATIHGDHTAIMEEWGDLSIDDIEYKAIEATQEEYEAWANDGWALATEPRRKCPCPDCTEHRARVSAKKETT